MEPNTHLERAVAQTKTIVGGVRDDQLSDPTPCTDWDVKALLGHVLGGAMMFEAGAREGSVPQSLMAEMGRPDFVGADFRERIASATDAMVAAFEAPGVLDRDIALPFATMPGAQAMAIATMDAAIHAADIAYATGQSFGDAELAEATIEMVRAADAAPGGFLRMPGVLGPEHPCDDAAAAPTRLLAFAGRKV